MSTAEDNDVSVCANCGKEGHGINNICNKCKQVRYCNAACKKKHRHKHKKECDEYVTELHDNELFKPPTAKDCPICFLLLPTLQTGRKYMACCGKEICSGCVHAPVFDNQGNEVDNEKCSFCRTPFPKSNKEGIERDEKRIEADDPIAMYNLGVYYQKGKYGYPQDNSKALELYHRAAKLGNAEGVFGYAEANCSIGSAYYLGICVEVDYKKAVHYYELAAMGGNVTARHLLGLEEENAGNFNRALKHYMIAVGGGRSQSLNQIKELYSKDKATKEDYTRALRLYQEYLGEIKSKQRDKAAAADEKNRYY